MTGEQITEKLGKFKFSDKFVTFYRIQPTVLLSADDQQDLVSEILNNCCRELIKLYNGAKKLPTKASLKKECIKCMNELYKADITEENRDFAYELCWYLCEIIGIDFKKISASKKLGYRNIK